MNRMQCVLAAAVWLMTACATDTSDRENPIDTGTPADGDPAPAPDSTPSGELAALTQTQIGDAIVNGSGCPHGTATLAVSSDKTTISVTTTAYKATTAGSLALRRRACIAVVSVRPPAGMRVGISRLEMTAQASIAAGSTGKVNLTKGFAFGNEDPLDATITGPRTGAVPVANDAKVTWSSCGASSLLELRTSLALTGTNSELGAPGFQAKLIAERCQ